MGNEAIVRVKLEDGPDAVDEPEAEGELARLMDRYGEPLFNFLLVLTRDQQLALDCLQDTFTRAFEHLCRGKAIGRPWLYTVARNRAIDEFRQRQRVRPDSAGLEGMAGADVAVNGRVQGVMAALPEEDREILYLFIFDRLKTAEIAHLLGIGEGAVRTRLYRARERFRALYGDSR